MSILKYIAVTGICILWLSCGPGRSGVQSEKNKNRGKIPEAGLIADKLDTLKYRLTDIPENQEFLLKGVIETKVKMIPNPDEAELTLSVPAEIELSAKLKKIGNSGKMTNFHWTLKNLAIYSPGPGVRLDYLSDKSGPHLRPQLKQLSSLLNKQIPIQVSEMGRVSLVDSARFPESESVSKQENDDLRNKLLRLIGYFFPEYPDKTPGYGDTYSSMTPFHGSYRLDSMTRDRKQLLIIPHILKIKDKQLVRSFLKGWLLVDYESGMMTKSFVEKTEKRQMIYKGIQSLFEIRVLLELNISRLSSQ